MNEADLMALIAPKEEASGCYDFKIDDICVYTLVRCHLRYKYLIYKGISFNNRPDKISHYNLVVTLIKSLYDILKLILFVREKDNVVIAFARLDMINGEYLDKFSDPVIDVADLDNYIILEHGRGGVHFTPRRHGKSVYYKDSIKVMSQFCKIIKGYRYARQYKREFNQLVNKLKYVYDDMPISVKEVAEIFAEYKTNASIMKFLLNKIGAKRVLGVCRDQLYTSFIAAKELGLPTFEFQHGITYSDSVLYSGYRDVQVTPDFFLAFGNNKPDDVYGIEPSNIVNIGWALFDYINTIGSDTGDDVLVISDPEITEQMLTTAVQLAKDNPNIKFHFRPHPLENLSNNQMLLIESTDNLTLNDKGELLAVVLCRFKHVIGENSTALYEALSMGKKVGKVYLNGLKPIYLEKEDVECFWQIESLPDFKRFIESDVKEKKSKSIYSKFDCNKFKEIISYGG